MMDRTTHFRMSKTQIKKLSKELLTLSAMRSNTMTSFSTLTEEQKQLASNSSSESVRD